MDVYWVRLIQCAVPGGAAVAEPGVPRDPSAEVMGHARAVPRQNHRGARKVLTRLRNRGPHRDPPGVYTRCHHQYIHAPLLLQLPQPSANVNTSAPCANRLESVPLAGRVTTNDNDQGCVIVPEGTNTPLVHNGTTPGGALVYIASSGIYDNAAEIARQMITRRSSILSDDGACTLDCSDAKSAARAQGWTRLWEALRLSTRGLRSCE